MAGEAASKAQHAVGTSTGGGRGRAGPLPGSLFELRCMLARWRRVPRDSVAGAAGGLAVRHKAAVVVCGHMCKSRLVDGAQV